jgi:hypothetical protein
MSKSKNTTYVADVVVLGNTRLAHYMGYGRFTWPSESTLGVNYATKVSEDRKTAACSCPEFPSVSKGDQCKHGRAALDVVRTYVDKHGSWEKPFPFQPYAADANQKSIRRKLKLKAYDTSRRLPPVKYNRPDGRQHRSAEQSGRRAGPTRVPDFLEQLMRGTAATLQHVEEQYRHRTRKKNKAGGRGRNGRLLAHRLYAIVMRHAYRSNLEQAKKQSNDMQTQEHIGVMPCENSVGHYFHQLMVRKGLRIWLAETARPVAAIARVALVDSTAFATSIAEDWRESEHGTKNLRATTKWLKAHVLSDAATNIIGGVIPTANRGYSADVTLVSGLLRLMRMSGWDIVALLGDKGYFDQAIRNWCEARKIKFFVPLKGKLTDATIDAWNKHNGCKSMPAYFKSVYRYRSKVESVFSAWKRMFQPEAHTRPSKKHGKRLSGLSLSQEIEILAYAVAYNLYRLATLEGILDQRIDLARGIYFRPMPDDWVSPESEVPSLYTAPDILRRAA